jgi:hypothetical protein
MVFGLLINMANQLYIRVVVLDQWIEDQYTEGYKLYILCTIGNTLYLLNKSINELD